MGPGPPLCVETPVDIEYGAHCAAKLRVTVQKLDWHGEERPSFSRGTTIMLRLDDALLILEPFDDLSLTVLGAEGVNCGTIPGRPARTIYVGSCLLVNTCP